MNIVETWKLFFLFLEYIATVSVNIKMFINFNISFMSIGITGIAGNILYIFPAPIKQIGAFTII